MRQTQNDSHASAARHSPGESTCLNRGPAQTRRKETSAKGRPQRLPRFAHANSVQSRAVGPGRTRTIAPGAAMRPGPGPWENARSVLGEEATIAGTTRPPPAVVDTSPMCILGRQSAKRFRCRQSKTSRFVVTPHPKLNFGCRAFRQTCCFRSGDKTESYAFACFVKLENFSLRIFFW
jgi:hypothetical protein